MSYNAGSIDSRLDLDRTPFQRSLQAARSEAEAFVRNPFTARLDLDSRRADAELRAFQGRMDIATRDRTTTIRVQTDQSALQRLQRLQDQINGIRTSSNRTSKDVQGDFNLMRTAIELLGPPLIPLAGGIAALGAGAATMAIVGVAAFASIKKEIEEGTRVGAQYSGGLQVIKGDLQQIEDTLARSTLPGFNQGIDSLTTKMPALNHFLGESGRILGDTVDHALNGLIGGFQTFEPVLLDVAHYVDDLATRFDNWANGPGGEKFAATLAHDLELAIPALENLIRLVSHLIAGFAPVGEVILGGITGISKVLNALPVGVVQAMATAYTAFRLTVAVTSGIEAARLALLGLASAEGAAAAGAGAAGAATGLRGALAGTLGVVGRYAGPVLGVALALNTAAKATDSWRTSQNDLKSFIGQTLDIFSHPFSFWKRDEEANQIRDFVAQIRSEFSPDALFTGSFDSLIQNGRPAPNVGPALAGPGTVEAYEKARPAALADIASQQKIINSLQAEYNRKRLEFIQIDRQTNLTGEAANKQFQEQSAALGKINDEIETHRTRIDNDRAVVEQATRAFQEQYQVMQQYTTTVAKANSQGLNMAYTETAGSSLTATASALGQYANQLQKNIGIESKWLDTQDKETVTIGDLTVGVDAAAKAYAQAGGDVVKAEAILKSHRIALQLDIQAQREALTEQANINKAIGDAATRYHLTTDQVTLYAEALGVSAEALGKGNIATDDFVRQIGRVAAEIKVGNTAVQSWVAAVDAYSKSGKTAADTANLIGAAMVSFNGDAISYANTMVQAATANQQLVTDLANVDKGIINLKRGTIDWHNAGAAPLLNDLQQLQTTAMNAAKATYQHEVATKGARQAAKDAADVFHNDTTVALRDEMIQLGYTKQQADRLANRYFNWPKDAKTQIAMLGGKDTNDILDAIGQQLSYLTGVAWDVNLQSNVSDINAQVATLRANLENLPKGTTVNAQGITHLPGGGGFASGTGPGGLPEGWSWVGDPGPHSELVHKRGSRVDVLSHKRSVDFANRTGIKVPSFAGGTGPGGFHGVDYGGGDGGSGSGSGGSGGTNDNGLTDAQQKEVDRLKGLLGGLTSALSSLSGQVQPVDSLTSALNTLTRALKKATDDNTLIKRLHREEEALQKDLENRDRYKRQLDNWRQRLDQDQSSLRQYRGSVRDTFLNQFNIGTSGNGYAYGIQASLEQSIADTQKFDQLKDRAQKLGLDPRLIEQLEQQGPAGAANLEAIVNQGKGYVKTINADYAKLRRLSGSVADEAAKDNVEINRRIERDQKEIKELSRKHLRAAEAVREDMKDIRHTVNQMENRLENALADARKKK